METLEAAPPRRYSSARVHRWDGFAFVGPPIGAAPFLAAGGSRTAPNWFPSPFYRLLFTHGAWAEIRAAYRRGATTRE